MFIDFKLAYDLIDRQTLFSVMMKFRVSGKTRAIIKQTVMDAYKAKFRGEISEPFEIVIDDRWGDEISPILFTTVLEKVTRRWKKAIKGEGIEAICLRSKRQGLKVECLVFADDLAFLAEDWEEDRKCLKIYTRSQKNTTQELLRKTV